MIEFKHVTKTYRSSTRDTTVIALNDVNLRINDGEVVFIVGENGSGKTTLMRLLTRMEVPTSGTLTVDGQDLKKIRKRKIPDYRCKIGMDFQDYRLFPKFTVYENVAFAMRVLGKSSKNIKKTVPLVLSMLDISARRTAAHVAGEGARQQPEDTHSRRADGEPLPGDEPRGHGSARFSRRKRKAHGARHNARRKAYFQLRSQAHSKARARKDRIRHRSGGERRCVDTVFPI